MTSARPTQQTSRRRAPTTSDTCVSPGSVRPKGKVFCLVDAPSAEAASTVHREAHGLVADGVFEVQEGL